MNMKEMVIDLETRSDKDITKCGVYAYADSPFFKIQLFSVSVDSGSESLCSTSREGQDNLRLYLR